jgi:acetyltransferase
MSAYPHDLESTGFTRDGAAVRLRPVRPEDEPLLHDLAAHMSPEDMRLRFFAPMHGLPRALAARLSHPDDEREMALLAECDGAALGVVRYAAEPDKRRAEYAIAVRSDWKGRGLGYLLMTRLIEIAAARGIGELVGEVLHENRRMLEMCRTFGFSLATDPDDAALVVVRKRLDNGNTAVRSGSDK